MDVSRRKSCEHCRLAKTRCNLDTPQCMRCKHRNLICKYDHRPRDHSKSNRNEALFHSWQVQSNVIAPQTNSPLGSNPTSVALMSPIVTARPAPLEYNQSAILELDGMYSSGLDWNNPGTWAIDIASPEMGAIIPNEEGLAQISNQRIPLETTHGTFGKESTPQAGRGDSIETFTKVSRVMKLTSDWKSIQVDTNSLGEQRPNLLARTQESRLYSLVLGNHVWSKIVSYVIDFRNGLLPPFIHNGCYLKTDNGEILDLPVPLANCRSIIQMYMNKSAGNSTLVFKTLLLEIQRLYNESLEYDGSALIYAIQALTLYVVMVAADKDRCKGISIIVRVAMGEIGERTSQQGYVLASELQGKVPDWESWIQVESRRRTLIILHFLARLVDVDVGISKPSGCSTLDDLPLSSTKNVWEAKTRTEWENEYGKYLLSKSSKELLRARVLRESSRSRIVDSDQGLVKDLSWWSKDMDDLGSLLMTGLVGLDFN